MKKLSALFAAVLMAGTLMAQAPALVETVWATYEDLSADYPNYDDPDWGMVSGLKLKVQFYDNDSLVIRNWFNQGVDLCLTYDADGYIVAANNPGSAPGYWAYVDATYWIMFACKAYNSSNCWISPATKELYLQCSWGSDWNTYYHLNWSTSATSVDNVEAAGKAEKRIEDGQLIILKDGVRYSANGMMLK